MERNLFFTPEFSQEFDLKGLRHLRVGSVLPRNKDQIKEGLRDMSPESIRYRFLGSKKEFSDKELQYLTELDGWNHYAIGVEEMNGHHRGVAIIRLVRSGENPVEAEIAITIIDEYQKKGLGTFLMDLIFLAAMERNIHRLSFTFLPQNEGIIHLIDKAGAKYTREQTHYYVQLYLDLKSLKVEEIKSRLQKTLPVIGTFHSKI